MGGESAEVVDLPAATSPAKTKRIDLDAARRARAEARREAGLEPPVVVIDGEDVELPVELPSGALTAFGALFAIGGDLEDESPEAIGRNLRALAALEEAAAELFGPAWPKLKSHGLSTDDLEVLLGESLEVYGISLPESGASGSSS